MSSAGNTELYRTLKNFATAKSPSPEKVWMRLLQDVHSSIMEVDTVIRPATAKGDPGGLIFLNQEIPLIILPDLHARRYFLFELLSTRYKDSTVFEALCSQTIQIICVGDGFHAEKRAWNRWQKAMVEYGTGFRRHKHMDMEMTESLGLMQMVMTLQCHFPENFFFLKGNHENILNEEGNGNHPFGKFVYEGEMVKFWTRKFMGDPFILAYYEYEHSLPYMALSKELIITHAEPAEYYPPEDIINIQEFDDIKLGLTWTSNGNAKEDSVFQILEHYSVLFNREFRYCIGGHRTIKELYKLRADGLYIQIHNPDKKIILFSDQKKQLQPDRDIMDLETIRSLEL